MSIRWVGALLALFVSASAAFCPHHCSCYTDPDGYVSANCSILALDAPIQPSPVERLSLQPRFGSYPSKLESKAFLSFQKIKFLWAINCSVLNIPNELFFGLHYLIRIDLSFNKIRHPNGAVFKNLESLTTLKLRGNPLELTPWDVIVSDSLQELDLGYCGLRTIPFGTFIRVPRLSRLYLDGNELKTFLYNTIPAGLHYVNLARNRISNVPTDVLSTMSNLRKLDLSKNPVNCTCSLLIMQDWFSGPGIIFDNGVTCVEPMQYAGMRLNKINENELCELEDMKRQRRINDIQSYRDSKTHRRHNMIHDPDMQSDQPDGHNYAEVLFVDAGTRGQTHMELDKHYTMSSDLSSESNKLAGNKLSTAELKHLPPTEVSKMEDFQTSKEELHENEGFEFTKDVDFNADNHSATPIEQRWTRGRDSFDSVGNTSSYPLVRSLSTKSTHEEMADEGYSPVYLGDIMLADEPGSGEEPEIFPTTDIIGKDDNSTLTTSVFTFPTSQPSSDYNYEAYHDYSGEATTTTEAIPTFDEEGSGEPDNETISNLPPLYSEDNETTSENYVTVDHSTDEVFSFSSEPTTDNKTDSSTDYSSSSSSPDIETPEAMTDSSTDIFDESSSVSSTEGLTTVASSSEYLNVSEESVTVPLVSISSEQPSSSSEPPTTTAEPLLITDAPPSSTESTLTYSPTPTVEITELPFIPRASSPDYPDETASPTSLRPEHTPSSSTTEMSNEIEILKHNINDTNAEIVAETTRGLGTKDVDESKLSYIILGLVLALVLVVAFVIICRQGKKMGGPCASKKKVRLPQDTEATPGTEMQDMLLPKPPENGVKIVPTNGKEVPNGKEEEVPVLQKDWEEKPEPIETVTARMSMLAGPQTPVFIHKTLA